MNTENTSQKQAMQERMMQMCSNMSMEECQQMMQRMMNGGHRQEERLVKDLPGTAQLKALFVEWCRQIREEMQEYANLHPANDADDLSEHFKLSKESCHFILNDLEL